MSRDEERERVIARLVRTGCPGCGSQEPCDCGSHPPDTKARIATFKGVRRFQILADDGTWKDVSTRLESLGPLDLIPLMASGRLQVLDDDAFAELEANALPEEP